MTTVHAVFSSTVHMLCQTSQYNACLTVCWDQCNMHASPVPNEHLMISQHSTPSHAQQGSAAQQLWLSMQLNKAWTSKAYRPDSPDAGRAALQHRLIQVWALMAQRRSGAEHLDRLLSPAGAVEAPAALLLLLGYSRLAPPDTATGPGKRIVKQENQAVRQQTIIRHVTNRMPAGGGGRGGSWTPWLHSETWP